MCLENLCGKSDILLREKNFIVTSKLFLVLSHRKQCVTLCMHVSKVELSMCTYAYNIIFCTSLEKLEGVSFEE